MRQLTYTAAKQLEWIDAREPRVSSDGSALVRPVAVATCDLDALIISGRSPFQPPFAIGHECVAEVVDVGDAVATVRPGQLVSVPFQISCGECAPCRRGRTGNCTGVPFMSTYGFGPAVEKWGGFLSDLVCVPTPTICWSRCPPVSSRRPSPAPRTTSVMPGEPSRPR